VDGWMRGVRKKEKSTTENEEEVCGKK